MSSSSTITTLRKLIPPALLPILVRVSGIAPRFDGNYASWEEARRECTGYEAEAVLKREIEEVEALKSGKSVWQGWGVLTDASYPVLAALLRVAAQNQGQLRVLDFGGSLGNRYYEFVHLLAGLNVQWCIVEQSHFVAYGQQHLQTDQLRFFATIEDCMAVCHCDVLLMSSVLQYLPRPHEFMQNALKHQFANIVIARTQFTNNAHDLLVVQRVPKSIYNASYPAWMLSKAKFQQLFVGYECLAEFDCHETYQIGWRRQIPQLGMIWSRLAST